MLAEFRYVEHPQKAQPTERLGHLERSRRPLLFLCQNPTLDLILLRELTSFPLSLSLTSRPRSAVAMLGTQVAIHHLNQEATSRGARMRRTALGPAIAIWLEDSAVVELMLNPDGRLWIDRLAGGLADTGERSSAGDGQRVVGLVRPPVGREQHPRPPR